MRIAEHRLVRRHGDLDRIGTDCVGRQRDTGYDVLELVGRRRTTGIVLINIWASSAYWIDAPDDQSRQARGIGRVAVGVTDDAEFEAGLHAGGLGAQQQALTRRVVEHGGGDAGTRSR